MLVCRIQPLEHLNPHSASTLRRVRLTVIYICIISPRQFREGETARQAPIKCVDGKARRKNACVRPARVGILKRRASCLDADGHLFGDYKGGWISIRIMTQFYNERSEL